MQQHNTSEFGQNNAGWELRNKYLPLPSKEQGYARMMFLGTTGAGKTTVIRQLIGTDPAEISFPAVSASRTTTCATEFILTPESTYSSIVTFISRAETKTLIEECIWEAFKCAFRGDDEKTISDAFLSHPEQRFRLYYLFGNNKPPKNNQIEPIVPQSSATRPYPDQLRLHQILRSIIQQIIGFSRYSRDRVAIAYGEDIEEAFENKRNIEDWLPGIAEDYRRIVNQLLEDIKSRFLVVEFGKYYSDPTGWPLYWRHQSPNKNEIISQMRWFAGNDSRRYGQLLAPLVNGIRVRGPFRPHWWTGNQPSLVIVDGEGVGHDSKITTSLKMDTTSRFEEVDAIVLVDNAAQPMIGIPNVIIHEVAVRGYYSKLLINYTHFDQVTGSNLNDEEERREHILTSQRGGLKHLKDAGKLTPQTVQLLTKHLREHVFFFGATNELKNPPAGLKSELEKFIAAVIKLASENKSDPFPPGGPSGNSPQGGTSITIPSPQGFFSRLRPGKERPKPNQDSKTNQVSSQQAIVLAYNFSSLSGDLRLGNKLFMDKWLTLLGLHHDEAFYPQHWTRIKALSRRYAEKTSLYYDNLDPAGDMANSIMTGIRFFLEKPASWPTDGLSDLIRLAYTELIAREISTCVNQTVKKRLAIKQHPNWLKAYGYSGTGSTKIRARDISQIYKNTLPDTENASKDEMFLALKSFLEVALNRIAADTRA